jgi:Ni,Fe-hydrogenase III small subunit/formate hydrogenlyase subunit 6/NADH:ubiquinone oxidoreductase subunit I
MLKAILARIQQKQRTIGFPKQPPVLPDRLRGRPHIDASKCPSGCRVCAEACPTDAISVDDKGVHLDLGRCLFCPECERACPEGAIRFTTDYRLSASNRDGLILGTSRQTGPGSVAAHELQLAQAIERKTRKLFGRSLKLRQVSAGGCGGCEADVNVLNTVVFDLGRFGIQFVASPRHADGLLITGPITRNMDAALRETYQAVASPKLVIALGACAITGGPFAGHPEQQNGVCTTLPVDLYVPGCPPHPVTILDGLLRLLGRIDSPC